MKVDTSAARTILGSFAEVHHADIDYGLYETVKDYKARVASKFKSITPDHIEKIQGNEFYISLKLDGEHCQLYFEDGQAWVEGATADPDDETARVLAFERACASR